jgi:hypothetical protein
LRRTFRTNLGRLKVRPDIAERLVNHASARTEMEETYDLYTYLPEMREAMEKWEELSPNNHYPAGRELSGLTVPDRNWGRLDKYSGLTA